MEYNDKLFINLEKGLMIPKTNEWNGGICDCFNNVYPSMICSFLTPHIYASIMYNYITKKKNYNPIFIYLFLNLTSVLLGSCSKLFSSLLFYIANFYILCVANFVRKNIRTINNIAGSDCQDSFLTVFCLPCSLSQSARTLYSHDTVCDNV